MTKNFFRIKHDISPRHYPGGSPKHPNFFYLISIKLVNILLYYIGTNQKPRHVLQCAVVFFFLSFFFFFYFSLKSLIKIELSYISPPQRLKIEIGCFRLDADTLFRTRIAYSVSENNTEHNTAGVWFLRVRNALQLNYALEITEVPCSCHHVNSQGFVQTAFRCNL